MDTRAYARRLRRSYASAPPRAASSLLFDSHLPPHAHNVFTAWTQHTFSRKFFLPLRPTAVRLPALAVLDALVYAVKIHSRLEQITLPHRSRLPLYHSRTASTYALTARLRSTAYANLPAASPHHARARLYHLRAPMTLRIMLVVGVLYARAPYANHSPHLDIVEFSAAPALRAPAGLTRSFLTQQDIAQRSSGSPACRGMDGMTAAARVVS